MPPARYCGPLELDGTFTAIAPSAATMKGWPNVSFATTVATPVLSRGFMRTTPIIPVIVAVMSVCNIEQAAAQAKPSQGDPRILMALRDSSNINMCEGDTRLALLEVAWKGADAGPSDEPPDVRWSSGNDSIVSVIGSSKLAGHKAGSTTVVATVQWGKFSARRQFPVQVSSGRFDSVASKAEDRLVCRE